MFGYIPVGMTFGFLLVKAGLVWYAALIMSVFVFSGATQFLMLSFIAAGTPLPMALFTMLLLNLRHAFFGLSLLRKYGGTGMLKPYLIFALTDETYALAASALPNESIRKRYFFFISIFDHLYWIIGSAVGALIGAAVHVELAGLDFALAALFTVLVIEQWKAVRRLTPFIVAAVSGILSLLFIPHAYMLLAAIVAGVIILLVLRPRNT